MSEMEKEDLTRYMRASLLSGQGKNTLKYLLHQLPVFQPKLTESDLSARNAGMSLILELIGGDANTAVQKLIDILAKGISKIPIQKTEEKKDD